MFSKLYTSRCEGYQQAVQQPDPPISPPLDPPSLTQESQLSHTFETRLEVTGHLEEGRFDS